MALPIFVITIFVSAFLLFLVQPMVGKLILPKLGGTPQVWNTCMVFFQSALLLGYAYTHTVTTRLKLRQQLMVHSGLLIVPIIMMLIFQMYDMSQAWEFPAGSNPILSALALLGIIVGVPFFVVSTSAPLLQRWFAYSGHTTAKDPYFLYAASNLGSLLSLYFYPIVIEPNTFLRTQSLIWFGGYIFLGLCVLYGVYTIFKLAPPDAVLAAEAAADATKLAEPPSPVGDNPVPAPAPAAEASTAVKAGHAPGSPGAGARAIQRKKGMKLGGAPVDDKPGAAARAKEVPDISYGAAAAMTNWRRLRWVLLAAVPSSLMLGTTSYISTDLSPFPLVWIIPLSLYLLSFILVYLNFWTGKRIFPMGPGYTMHDAVLFVLQPIGILILAFVILTKGFHPVQTTFLMMLGFFANALGCHGELAKDRPSTRHLTEYFLLMSVGGMIGGVFNGILAPVIFQTGVLEFNIAICVACFVRPLYMMSGWFEELLYSIFPGFQGWVRAQGDEMAKSMGRPAPNSSYLFSYFLDIVFAFLLCMFVYWVSDTLNYGTKTGRENLVSVMKYLPVSKTQAGMQVAFNILVFFIPMVFCFFFAGRPVRMGLAVTALLVGHLYLANADDRRYLEGGVRRTYFGLLRVQLDEEQPRDPEEQKMFRTKFAVTKAGEPAVPAYPYTFLMHGTTYHGRNYLPPDKENSARVDLTRLATTYYHRYGPVGIVMEQYNWFPGAQNTFRADARMPTTIVGQIAATIGVGNLPLAALVETQSEPPYATIGLGTGTMASYSRPYQHMCYYEIDDVIREFNLPTDEPETMRPRKSPDAFFTYLQHAIKRGVNLEVIMGDARQSLSNKREEFNRENSFVYSFDFNDKKYNIPLHTASKLFPNRDGYYWAINVDAFSSDAIPIHLVTEQAIALYLSKMNPQGVLCVHTSNRHMDLVVPVSRIALQLSEVAVAKAEKDVEDMSAKQLEQLFPPKEGEQFDLKKAKEAYVKSKEINVRVGKDGAEREAYMGHFSSEYVMIYRGDGFEKYLAALQARKNDLIKAGKMRADGGAPDGDQILNSMVVWYNPFDEHDRSRGPNRRIQRPVSKKDALWTDDYSHILSVIRWPEWWPF